MKKRNSRSGFTLLEIMIALSILVISIIGLVSVISYTTTHNEVNRENLLAMRAAEAKIEEMRQWPVSEIFFRYSITSELERIILPLPGSTYGSYVPHNMNPPVPNPYPGADFSYDIGTDPTYSRLQNVSATITFPRTGVLLKEDPLDPDPIARDLNSNNNIGDDPTLDYRVLPATITIRWTGIKGARTITYRYMFLRRG